MADVFREGILKEINDEREAQVAKWGNETDDTKNKPNDWASYIANHATKWFDNTFPPYKAETVLAFRTQMIRVAALAVAAAESVDRQFVNGKPFYQE